MTNNRIRSIGSKAFANCRQLKYIYFDNDSVSIAEDAFEGCYNNIIIGPSYDNAMLKDYAKRHNFEFIIDESGNG